MLLAREVDDVEAVFRAKRAHAEEERRARLLHLALLGHRAGGVEHEDDVFGRVLGLGHLVFGRDGQEEVALPARLAVREERHAEVRVRERVEELEVLRLRARLRLEGDARFVLALARHVDLVARRVDVAHAFAPLDLDAARNQPD